MIGQVCRLFCVLSLALSANGCGSGEVRSDLNPEALGDPFFLVAGSEGAKAWRQIDGTVFLTYLVQAEPEQIRTLLAEETHSAGWLPVQNPWFDTWHDIQEGSGSVSTDLLKTIWRDEGGFVFSYNIEHRAGLSGSQSITIKMWMVPPSHAGEYVDRWEHMNALTDLSQLSPS